MYLEHYGLSEAPFRITPHTDFFFSGANRGATLEALLYAITHDEGIVKISGEVGSGKTMLCRVLMERLPANVVIVYLANPSLSRDDILYALSDELGIELPEHSRSGIVMRALQEKLLALYAAGKQVVVLIDEAHAMPMETLEEIRLLSNLESNRHKLLQLVLFGQPELDETLRRSDMRQLRERITHNFRLEPLIREDIAQYLDFRMRAAGYRGPNVFAPAAVKLIAQTSLGLTRRINILADKALLASYAAGTHQVGTKEARAAIRDSEFSSPRSAGDRLPAGLGWAFGGALATLAAVGAWQFVAQPAEVPASAPVATPVRPVQPAPAAAPVATAPAPPAPVVVADEQPQANPPLKTSATPLLDRLLDESLPWLAAVPDNHWFVQLYTADDGASPELVEKFLSKALKSGLDPAQLRAYHYQKGNLNRYGVIYGDYVSRGDAVTMLNTLPVELKRTRPYPRQTIRLKPESNNETPS
jgi:type II secretory pathway predicted ATPase ExeA